MTQHPYAYVGNNPINNLDPTGHYYDPGGNYHEISDDGYKDLAGEMGIEIKDTSPWKDIVDFALDDQYNNSGGGAGGGGGSSSSGGGDGGSSGGVGESRPPTLEERNQVYSQASQMVSTMYKLQANTLKQIVSYIKSMPGKPGLSNYGWNQDQVQKYAGAADLKTKVLSRDMEYHTVAYAGVYPEAIHEATTQPTPAMKAAAFGIIVIVSVAGEIAIGVKNFLENASSGQSVNDAVFGPTQTSPWIYTAIPDYPTTPPDVPPADDYEWKGQENSSPGSKEGNWVNPKTGEVLRPDLEHPTHGPHWDYREPNRGPWWRLYPDGRKELKNERAY